MSIVQHRGSRIGRAGLLLGLLWVAAACARPAGSAESEPVACCQSRYPRATLPQYSTAQLGQEYQRLKRRKCEACKRYGSDLQQLMNALGTRLDGQPRAAVARVMGKPDEVTANELIYHWRYRHDFLRFELKADGTVASSWYYALE